MYDKLTYILPFPFHYFNNILRNIFKAEGMKHIIAFYQIAINYPCSVYPIVYT